MKLRIKLWFVMCGMAVELAIVAAYAQSFWLLVYGLGMGIFSWNYGEYLLEQENKNV